MICQKFEKLHRRSGNVLSWTSGTLLHNIILKHFDIWILKCFSKFKKIEFWSLFPFNLEGILIIVLHTRAVIWLHSISYFRFFLLRFFKCLFIFKSQRDRAWVGEGQRERETQNLKQDPGSEPLAQRPMWGSNPWTVRSWPDLKSDA